jgi:hypothetical protein
VGSPARADITVARADFALGRRLRALGGRPPITIAPTGPLGFDHVAAGTLQVQSPREASVLILVVNRRPAVVLAADLARVNLRISGPRLRSAPKLDERLNGLAERVAGAMAPALCRGATTALPDGAAQPLLDTGATFAVSATHALPQGFDTACNLPVDPAFQQAVQAGGGTPAPQPQPLPQPQPKPCPPCPPCPQCGARRTAIVCPAAAPVIPCPLTQ